MIPKVIHYCWLSGDTFPIEIQKCIDSWKEILPDYEFICWDTNRFNLDTCSWVKQAFEAKKYAFAADYIRLYAVYNYGGIYLDSDVMMYKSFNDLLDLPYFLGEDIVHCFEPAIFGAEKGTQWVKDVLDRYDSLEFINQDGSFNMRGLPVVFHDRLCPKYVFELTVSKCEYEYKEDVIRIFPSNYFNSRNYIEPIQTAESYCSHHFVGSWLKKSKTFSSRLKAIVPHSLLNIVYSLLYKYKYSRSLKEISIPYNTNNKSNLA